MLTICNLCHSDCTFVYFCTSSNWICILERISRVSQHTDISHPRNSVSSNDSPRRRKDEFASNKVLTIFFWEALILVLIDYLRKIRTINIEYYANSMSFEKNEIWSWPKCYARIYMSIVAVLTFNELTKGLILRSQYYPDLTPRDYIMLPNLGDTFGFTK